VLVWHRFKHIGDLEIGLGMAGQEPAAVGRAGMKAPQQAAHEIRLEIDHNVAAQDDVEGGRLNRIGPGGELGQVVLVKPDAALVFLAQAPA
jgi:hypothetical protein